MKCHNNNILNLLLRCKIFKMT